MTVVPEKEDRGTCIIAGLKNKLPTHAESREFCYEYQTNQHTTCVFWKKRLHPSEAQEWTVVSSEGRISLLIAGMAEKPTGPYQIAVSWKAPRIKSKTAGHRLPSREFCQGILCWVLNQSLLKILPWLHKVLVDDSTTRCFFSQWFSIFSGDVRVSINFTWVDIRTQFGGWGECKTPKLFCWSHDTYSNIYIVIFSD